MNSLYVDDAIIGSFRTLVRKHWREVFLYLKNPEVEKTSDVTEQRYPIQRWFQATVQDGRRVAEEPLLIPSVLINWKLTMLLPSISEPS